MDQRVADVSRRAVARSGVVDGPALGGGRARRVVETRVHALVLHARLISRAVRVDLAFDAFAPSVRVAEQAARTFAGGEVVLRNAFGVDGARVRNEAGIDTLVVVTGFCQRAVRV